VGETATQTLTVDNENAPTSKKAKLVLFVWILISVILALLKNLHCSLSKSSSCPATLLSAYSDMTGQREVRLARATAFGRVLSVDLPCV
jgi:hypothetical protein